jgi:hypothetical protein
MEIIASGIFNYELCCFNLHFPFYLKTSSAPPHRQPRIGQRRLFLSVEVYGGSPTSTSIFLIINFLAGIIKRVCPTASHFPGGNSNEEHTMKKSILSLRCRSWSGLPHRQRRMPRAVAQGMNGQQPQPLPPPQWQAPRQLPPPSAGPIPPIAPIPPLGASSCSAVRVCNATASYCVWQQVCR